MPMPYQEFQENLQLFSKLIDELRLVGDERTNTLINYYVEQNVELLNDVFSASIHHLKKLEKVHSVNEIICTQARFTHEINQKISLCTQRFLNMSLGQNADYNEWLKAHCDLATD